MTCTEAKGNDASYFMSIVLVLDHIYKWDIRFIQLAIIHIVVVIMSSFLFLCANVNVFQNRQRFGGCLMYELHIIFIRHIKYNWVLLFNIGFLNTSFEVVKGKIFLIKRDLHSPKTFTSFNLKESLVMMFCSRGENRWLSYQSNSFWFGTKLMLVIGLLREMM